MSLIELMVASLVLGVIVVGTTSMLGSGQRLGYGNDLRRQARIRATAALEDSIINRMQHNSTYSPLAGELYRRTIQLDSGKAATVEANLIVGSAGSNEQMDFRDPVNGGSPILVNYYRMQATILWTFEGVTDSIVLTKRVPRT